MFFNRIIFSAIVTTIIFSGSLDVVSSQLIGETKYELSAKPKKDNSSDSSSEDGLPPTDPNEGEPKKGPQAGGATRPGDSQCPQVKINPIAIIPKKVEVMSGKPNLWFYVPYSPGEIYNVSLVIQDENHNYIQRETSFSLSDTPGFVRFEFPSHALPLDFGKFYVWTVIFYCNENNREDFIALRGNLIRKSSNDFGLEMAHNEIQKLPISERVRFYIENVENDLWYDAFNFLTNLRLKFPNNLQYEEKWKELFNWLEEYYNLPLDSIEDAPISSCCSTEPSEIEH
jgi:hypothetical protein